MTEPLVLADTRDPEHTVPVAVIPIGTLAAMHHTLSSAYVALTDVDCGCSVGERCLVDETRDEAEYAVAALALRLVTIPDHVLADLDHEPAVWIAQIKTLAEDQATAAGA